ncbi:MAG: energy transducer TonB [Sphingobacteriales bacterium]|nr:energy transducer TonB [Sphingobacteriales bacterium]
MIQKKKKDFIKKHEYPGGRKAFQEFIKSHLTYPENARKNRVEGDVFLEYQVGFDGQVSHVKVLKGIGAGCDEEAVRILKLLKFAPQKNHGVRIISTHKIKMHFQLPKETEKKAVQIRYAVPVKAADKKKTGKSGYSYTLKF